MKRQRILISVLALGLLLALAVGLSQAQGPGPEGEVQPRGEVSIAATVGSRFSYQGVLKENGSRVTGSRDMTFRLYSDDACSTQVGSDIAQPGVQVNDGLFSVELSVTHSHFNGQGLWLEVEVGGTQIGCQEILPVPYALSLRPGAIISATKDGILTVRSTGTGDSDAFIAYAEGYGEAVTAYTTDGVGVFAQSDAYVAVQGYSNDIADHPGVFGCSATSNSTCDAYRDDNAAGVMGYSENDYAGYFVGNSGGGVYAFSDSGTGIRGYSGSSTGVYGYSASGTAIYGHGDVKQVRSGNGLVKAAVYGFCGDAGLCPPPKRSFNNVTADAIDILCGASEGRCTIDFTFDISDRFWVATAVDNDDLGVTCELGSSDDQLDCFRYNASSGAGDDGDIMVLLY